MSTPDGWLTLCWLDFITEAPELRTELRRGKVLARKGRVGALSVRPGLITAEVTSDGGTTYTVRIRQPVVPEPEWKEIVGTLAKNAGFAAELLQGRLSQDMMIVFHDHAVELYPFDVTDIKNYCSCGSGPVCVHAVATHLAFAKAIASSASLLFTFRGMPSDKLIKEVRKHRAVKRPKKKKASSTRSGLDDPATLVRDFWRRGDLPSLSFHYETEGPDSNHSLHVLRALGPGPANLEGDGLADVLDPIVRVARSRLASTMDSIGDFQENVAQGDATVPSDSLDDLLLAAAKKHGSLTSRFVAEALAIPSSEATQFLDWLVEDGRLAKQSDADGSRYVVNAMD